MITPFGDDSTTARNRRSVGARGGRGSENGAWVDTASQALSGGAAAVCERPRRPQRSAGSGSRAASAATPRDGAQSIAIQTTVQRAPVESEHARRRHLVAPGAFEHVADVVPLARREADVVAVGEGGHRDRRGRARRGRAPRRQSTSAVRMARRTSRPPVPGMHRSTAATSWWRWRSSLSASAPSAQSVTSNPARSPTARTQLADRPVVIDDEKRGRLRGG